MKLKYFLFFAVIFITGCLFKSTNKAALPGTWRLYDVTDIGADSAAGDAFSKSAALKTMVTAGAALSFFDDGTYTLVKGNGIFTNAGWKFMPEKNLLYFIDSGRTEEVQKVMMETNLSGKQTLTITSEQKKIALKFVKESAPLKEFTSDPFYAGNNRWRIKALQEETPTQLTSRLANYFKHLALILKAAKERKQTVVSFEFSQGPIKIYNGGIGIHPYNIVPQYWKEYFYNDADAATAYNQYQDYLRTSSYKGAATGDWIDDDYNILLSIYAGLTQQGVKKNP